MREPYSQFRRQHRLPGEPFRPAYRKRSRANRSFASQLAAGIVFAALFGWQTGPEIKAWWGKANRTPEQIAAMQQSVFYSGCDEARAAGAAPIYQGQPGYREGMDGDHDGIACEPYR